MDLLLSCWGPLKRTRSRRTTGCAAPPRMPQEHTLGLGITASQERSNGLTGTRGVRGLRVNWLGAVKEPKAHGSVDVVEAGLSRLAGERRLGLVHWVGGGLLGVDLENRSRAPACSVEGSSGVSRRSGRCRPL